MNIGIDIDGVVYNWVDQYRRFCDFHLGMTGLPEIQVWSFYKEWGITTPEFLSHLASYPSDIYELGYEMPGAVDGLRDLSKAGHKLYALTARPDEAIQVTFDWLLDLGVRWHGIVVGDDKGQLKTDVMLDDGPHNIEALQAAGHPRPIVFDQKWNAHVDAERVYSWAEFVAAVNG